jgi:hypothetical protein
LNLLRNLRAPKAMHTTEYTLYGNSVIFGKPVADAIWDIPNWSMKHLYMFVINTGVAVLHKYEVGETL